MNNKENILSMNNTIGSTDFPLEVRSIFIGSMLGDGSLYRSSPTSNVRFEVSFGQKYQLFALHLGEVFTPRVNT